MKSTFLLLLLLVGLHAACGESKIGTMLLRTMQDIAGIVEDVKMLQDDISSMRTKMDTDISSMRTKMDTDISSMRTKMDTDGQMLRDDISSMRTKMDTDGQMLRDDLFSMQYKMDSNQHNINMLRDDISSMRSKMDANAQVNNHGCYFELTSWGMEDPSGLVDHTGWVASVGIDGLQVAEMNWFNHPAGRQNKAERGIGVLVATKNDGGCSMLSWQQFDTFYLEENGKRLANHVANLRAGSIIAVISADAPTRYGEDIASSQLKYVHPILLEMGVDLSGMGYRGSVAFLAVKGTKYHTVVDIRKRGKGPAKVSHMLY